MMIHLEGINKTYFNGAPLHVLKGIDLDIEKGEMVSIMGASGSGKSTLLNILGILDTYDTGTYTLNGQLIRNLSETRAAELRNRMIGFIFQSFNLISFKNAMENVALPLYYQGISRKKRNAMALEYLDMVGLKDWAEHMPNEMSGGQKQRVAIARALIAKPQVILADVGQQDDGRGDGAAPESKPRRADDGDRDARTFRGRGNRPHYPRERRSDRNNRKRIGTCLTLIISEKYGVRSKRINSVPS